jgi:hypothetical protein
MRILLRLGILSAAIAIIGAACDSPTSPRPGREYHLVSSSGHLGGALESGIVRFPASDRIVQDRVFSTDEGASEQELTGRYRIVRDSVLEVTWVESATWVHWGVFRGDTLELQLIGAGDWPIREIYTRRR